jgi:hypothetical protein
MTSIKEMSSRGTRIGRYGIASAAAALTAVVVLAAAPASGQAVKRPPQSANPFAEGLELCLGVAEGAAAMEATLTGRGWNVDDRYGYGPYQETLSASRFTEASDFYLYASVEVYPTLQLVYCTYEVEGLTATVDFNGVASQFGMTGEVRVQEDGTFGTWELIGEDTVLFVLASVEEDYLYLQVNYIGGRTSTGAVGGIK